MALPLGNSDRTDIIKFDAKAAKWKVDDKVMNSITMIVDMDNLEVGPMKFVQGGAPEFHLVRAADLGKGVSMPPVPKEVDEKGKPTYRNGFRATVKLPDKIANGIPSVREWASSSSVTCKGVNALHDLWLAEKAKHPGKVPVVKMTNAEVSSGAFGDNYKPILTIVNWVDRPADLRPNGAAAPAAPRKVAGTESEDPFAEEIPRAEVDDVEDDGGWGTGEPVEVDRDDNVSFS